MSTVVKGCTGRQGDWSLIGSPCFAVKALRAIFTTFGTNPDQNRTQRQDIELPTINNVSMIVLSLPPISWLSPHQTPQDWDKLVFYYLLLLDSLRGLGVGDLRSIIVHWTSRTDLQIQRFNQRPSGRIRRGLPFFYWEHYMLSLPNNFQGDARWPRLAAVSGLNRWHRAVKAVRLPVGRLNASSPKRRVIWVGHCHFKWAHTKNLTCPDKKKKLSFKHWVKSVYSGVQTKVLMKTMAIDFMMVDNCQTSNKNRSIAAFWTFQGPWPSLWIDSLSTRGL